MDRSLHDNGIGRTERQTLISEHKRPLEGQITFMFALALVGVVSLAALGVDVFYIYWNKNRLQSGTDAGALAGAIYLNGVTFAGNNVLCTYSTDAQNAACSYALDNGILPSELTTVVANSGSQSMTVGATRKISALFARIVGIQNFSVSATSVAVLRALASARGVVPIGLDAGTVYSYGQSILMHNGGCGPGCWQGLALQSENNGNSGAYAFEQNVAIGCSCTVNVGDGVTTEPGATVGPISQGVSRRVEAGIASDSSGTWSSHSVDDMRAAVVPVVDWSGCKGQCTAPVTGFAEVWILGSDGSDINVVFIRQVAPGNSGSTDTNMGAVHAQLTE